MKLHPIYITTGTGRGPTPLASFDAALFDAGVANHNLIHLSSVIPPGCKPIVRKVKMNNMKNEYGRRLYVVYASKIESDRGRSAYAGLGWVTTKAKEPRGLFVEHVGEDERDVIAQIKLTLGSMTRYRKERYGPIHCKTIGVHCTDDPVCALVVAVYQSVPWEFGEK